jgi:hypothetical protein
MGDAVTACQGDREDDNALRCWDLVAVENVKRWGKRFQACLGARAEHQCRWLITLSGKAPKRLYQRLRGPRERQFLRRPVP